jgi:hypothetical protein
MKLRVCITFILIASLFLMIARAATAQETIQAGVKSGDSFTYTVTGSHSTDDPSAEIPADVLSAEASSYFKITINYVAGPEINYTWLWHFTNGTDQNGLGFLNVETTAAEGPFWPIVAANLTAGELIHPHFGPDLSTFNETVMWTYTNYTRETNRLETVFLEQNNVTQTTRLLHSDSYFDKRTGMLVQLNEETDYQNPTLTTIITWKLAGQNAWTYASAGSFPLTTFFTLPVIIAIVVIVAILVIILGFVILNKRRNAKRKQLLKKK